MIKSFKVDHTKLTAPMIRLADTYTKDGVTVNKYDLRFVTPNTTYIEDKTLHSMEHLLAISFHKTFGEDMIDISPMGCKTGFYFTTFETDNELEKILLAISNAKDVVMPNPTKRNCGSYTLHNVAAARTFLERIADDFSSSSNS